VIRIPFLHAGKLEAFPPLHTALREPNGLIAAAGDLSPERLLLAYRSGIFPWFSRGEPILWWSPDPRLVFDTGAMHIPKRLRRELKHCEFHLRADTAFTQVMRACAKPRPGQDGTWITKTMLDAYTRLHQLGHAHSVEVYAGEDLVGGIYGVAIGRMFFGESMFSRADNASKVALLGLAQLLKSWEWPLIDAQVASAHLYTLGGFEMPRDEFAVRVAQYVALPGRPSLWLGAADGLRPCDF